MKIGLLYPRSKTYPGMMEEFVGGLKANLKFTGREKDIHWVMESAGFGGNEKEIYEKVERLLVLEKADLLIVYVDLKVLPILEPLVSAHQKFMLVVNPGANYHENWVPQSGIAYLTLQQSLLCWMTGVMVAKKGHGTAALATSFYDAGYHHIAAITNSYALHGGQIAFNYVNRDTYNETFILDPLLEYLSSQDAAVDLIAVFDQTAARLFYPALNNYSGSEKLHAFASPMMFYDDELIKTEFRFSIEGYIPYHPDSGTAANKTFKSQVSAEAGLNPSLFALLGWEAGIIVGTVIQKLAETGMDADSIVRSLIADEFETPRGDMILDEETHYFITPVYLAIKKQNQSGLSIEKIDDFKILLQEFIANPITGISSGWSNTYLCY